LSVIGIAIGIDIGIEIKVLFTIAIPFYWLTEPIPDSDSDPDAKICPRFPLEWH
jgi:hypothetical protein